MTIRQAAYRFGTNELTESTHGFLAALNTPISRAATDLTTFLCRVLIQNDATGAVNNVAPTWQRSINGGAFAAITTASTGVKAVVPSCWADAANTTSRLGGTGTFNTPNNGCTADGTAGGAAMDIVASGNSETEIALQLVAGLSAGDTIDLRILNGSTAITITQTPRINITGLVTIVIDGGSAAAVANDTAAKLAPVLDSGTAGGVGSDIANLERPPKRDGVEIVIKYALLDLTNTALVDDMKTDFRTVLARVGNQLELSVNINAAGTRGVMKVAYMLDDAATVANWFSNRTWRVVVLQTTDWTRASDVRALVTSLAWTG